MILFAVVIGVIEGAAVLHPGATSPARSRPARRRRPAIGDRPSSATREGSTLFYPVLLYQHGFRYFHMGYASAMAMVLLVVAFAVTVLIVRNSRRWVHYAEGRDAATSAPASPRRAGRRAPSALCWSWPSTAC